jgi:hypothetical protein
MNNSQQYRKGVYQKRQEISTNMSGLDHLINLERVNMPEVKEIDKEETSIKDELAKIAKST